MNGSVPKSDEAHEEAVVSAARIAGVHSALPYRPGEWPGAEVLAALREPSPQPPKTSGAHVYVALIPLQIGDDELGVGDVMTPAEAESSGSALARLVGHGHLAALPVDSGIVGAVNSLLRRCSRLEAVIRLGAMSDAELEALARSRGITVQS